MPLKDIALPAAVGAKMSTTNGNTAEIGRPVGMIRVQLIEGVRATDGAGQRPGDYLPRGDLDRTPSRPLEGERCRLIANPMERHQCFDRLR